MKKIVMLLMMMVLFCAIPETVQAAGPKITVSGTSAERSQMVYLTVSLEGCDKANTLGITLEYDSDVLKKVASDCTWTEKGVLQDFDVAKNKGVWAIKNAKDLNGEICTLAFRVKQNAPIGDTEVACTVVAKDDAKTIGTYSAKGTVSVICEHSYGGWNQKDSNTHGKVCKYCQSEITASHKWDEGVVTKQPTENHEGVRIYTCDVCGGSKEVAISVNGGTIPSEPDDSIQTPEKEPTVPGNEETSPGEKPVVPDNGEALPSEKPNVPDNGETIPGEKPNVDDGNSMMSNESPSVSSGGTTTSNHTLSGNSDGKTPGNSDLFSMDTSDGNDSQGTIEPDQHITGETIVQENSTEKYQNPEDNEHEILEAGNSEKTNYTTYYLVGGAMIGVTGIGILVVKRLKIKK